MGFMIHDITLAFHLSSGNEDIDQAISVITEMASDVRVLFNEKSKMKVRGLNFRSMRVVRVSAVLPPENTDDLADRLWETGALSVTIAPAEAPMMEAG